MDDVFDMDGRSPSLQIKADPDSKAKKHVKKQHKAPKAKKKKRDDWEEWNL